MPGRDVSANASRRHAAAARIMPPVERRRAARHIKRGDAGTLAGKAERDGAADPQPVLVTAAMWTSRSPAHGGASSSASSRRSEPGRGNGSVSMWPAR